MRGEGRGKLINGGEKKRGEGGKGNLKICVHRFDRKITTWTTRHGYFRPYVFR
jgi:hypothetical protein